MIDNELMNRMGQAVGGRNEYDAIIVGAGPAGASTAIGLAQRGRRVLLVEAKSFPRHKLCGEFISPECLTHFARLGVESQIVEARGALIDETIFFAASGRGVRVPSEWFGRNGEQYALGLSRAEMDNLLLARARQVGAEVHENAQATGLMQDKDGRVRGVRLRAAPDFVQDVQARVTIDATGRGRTLVRRLKAARHDDTSNVAKLKRKRASLVAFKAHLENVTDLDVDVSGMRARRCEIYFYSGGYGGLNDVEAGKSNLCFIVPAESVHRWGGDAERVLREVMFANCRARAVLESARVVTPWSCVALEGFGCAEPVPANGLLAVGDAAAFIDPFTGSGMLMALEGGELATNAIARWLAHNEDFAALATQYRVNYAAKFSRRLSVCAMLRRAAFAPQPAIEAAVKLLSTSSGARRLLARATRGDNRTNSFATR